MLVAPVSDVFVASVQDASVQLGLTPAFAGFIVVAKIRYTIRTSAPTNHAERPPFSRANASQSAPHRTGRFFASAS